MTKRKGLKLAGVGTKIEPPSNHEEKEKIDVKDIRNLTIFSSKGSPINLSENERDMLNKHYSTSRKIWPGVLAWHRVRNHAPYQPPEGLDEAHANALWADRRAMFIEGWNVGILMDDANTIQVSPVKPDSGIVTPNKPKLII